MNQLRSDGSIFIMGSLILIGVDSTKAIPERNATLSLAKGKSNNESL